MTEEEKLKAWWIVEKIYVFALVGRTPEEGTELIGGFESERLARAAVGAHNEQKRQGKVFLADGPEEE